MWVCSSHNKTCGNTSFLPKGMCHSHSPPYSKPTIHTVRLGPGNSMVPHSTMTAISVKNTFCTCSLNKTISWKIVNTAVKTHREKRSIKTSSNTVTAMVTASLSPSAYCIIIYLISSTRGWYNDHVQNPLSSRNSN